MMDNEELLFNELYEKTKDCGRTQFVRLLMEKDRKNQELNKKYLNAVADYETTMAEKEQLNRLVNSCQEEIRKLKKQVETYEIEGYKQNEELDKMSFDIRKYKTQQKEFIKWLEDKIKFSVKPTSRVLLKSILANYKEITGVSDENNNE